MNISCRHRVEIDVANRPVLPQVVRECTFTPRGQQPRPALRIAVGKRDHRFWHVAAVLLDLLESAGGSLSQTADLVGITSGNLTRLFKSHRHLFTAAQEIRKAHDLRPIH